MATVQPGIADRTKNIILTPKTEWPVIDAEPATIGDIYKSYVLPLAAIPAIAGLIGDLLFGFTIFGVSVKMSPVAAIGHAITGYIMSLISVFVLAVIIDALAPTFGGTKNQVQAFKVAAYSATASWLAGVLLILPSLAPIAALLSLYGLYLLYLGLPLLMRSPPDRALGYTVVTIIAAILLFIVAGAIVSSAGRLFGPPPITVTDATLTGAVAVPGGASIDLAQLGAAARAADLAAKGAVIPASRAVAPAVSPSSLLALLPPNVGSYHRTEVASSGANVGGIGGAHAEARYKSGDSNIKLGLTDLSAAGAIASLGGALNIQANRDTATGYEHTRSENGRLVSEKWDRPSQVGSYAELVDNRFMISAEGRVADISDLKRAAATIPPEELAKLAH